jgi:hypothetical protein
MFEGKWEDLVEDMFMSSYGSWAFSELVTILLSVIGCSM